MVIEHKSNRRAALGSIRRLAKRDVLVGISQETAYQDVPSGDMNNAAKAFISDQGAPEANIPQREFMRPGIESGRAGIAKQMALAGKAMLRGDESELKRRMEAAGLVAQGAIREYMTDATFQPLAEFTLEQRRARGVTREDPLIDTGAMRQAITYIVE